MKMMLKNKKGWIRVTEAVVAILIMASVLIVVYTNQQPVFNLSSYVYDLQVRLLTDVAGNPGLRNATLYENMDVLRNYFDSNVPNNFNYNISICNLGESCEHSPPETEREIFVEDRIISSNLEIYSPKLLRLYLWEKR